MTEMNDFIKSITLLLVLLNPFLVVVYLIDVMQKLDRRQFRHVLLRAGLIAGAVFCCFAILGDAIFSDIVQVNFASFQIFGGLVFLLIGFQFVFRGPTSIEILRGESEHLAGAIAMPVLIGPGTVSASVIIGKHNDILLACAAIAIAIIISIAIMLLLKSAHDFMRPRQERLIQRYIEIAGRITALYVGTVSVEMIMQGLRTWLGKF
jgi:small neutral amino acid transporter SnatA (MarC family)